MNDEEYRDKISLDDLYHRTQEVEDLRIRVYKKILNRAHQKIKYASRALKHIQIQLISIAG